MHAKPISETMNTENNAPFILLIDDQRIAEELVSSMLVDQVDIRLHYLQDSAQAVDAALALHPTVVVVDLRMPLIDGFAVTRALRAHPETDSIPVILLSSEESADVKAQAFAEGANDYLVKWPDKRELTARVRYHSSAYIARKQRDQAFASLQASQRELLLRTQELAQSQAALHQAQKMEAIGQLTGGIAHDINNVLQLINGNLELLKFLTAGNGNAQDRIEAALAGVARGAKLCSQLLAFSRRQPLQSVILDTRRLLANVDELLRRSLVELDIETVIAADLWNVTTDASQLENVLLNLAINARHAMEGKKGRLVIHARNVGPGAGECAEMPDNGQYVLIEMADTGVGMPPEVLQRAFEPFFTTKPLGEGTGLGLSMAYGFAKQNGGHILLDSRVGRGTSVRLLLPRADGDARSDDEGPLDDSPGGAETVLVVEDEEGIRSATVQQLSELGYRTLQAEDAAQALRIIESGEHVDLLFCDVVMPGTLRSTELVERVQRLLPELRVLFTSGYSEGVLARQGQVAPDVHLLQKPYGLDALSRKIRQVLARTEPCARDRAGSARQLTSGARS